MHDVTAVAKPPAATTVNPNFVALHRRYPTTAHLRRGARRHVPYFAYEYMDGGAGADGGIARNWNALDAVELVPRYGIVPTLPPTDVTLFGRPYSAPLGIAPMGGPSIVWPGADAYLATAAQRARVPYVLSTVAGMTIERAAEIAPDVFWFQLYRFATTITASASTWSGARTRRAHTCSCLRSTCRSAPRARARSRSASPIRSA